MPQPDTPAEPERPGSGVQKFLSQKNRLAPIQAQEYPRQLRYPQGVKLEENHSRIADTRKDYLHKVSTAISKIHAMVCMEDLPIRNMSGSASGTKEFPGKNVRAKSGRNKSILDQGWYEFRRQQEYKLTWRGGILIAVPLQNTSRTCPCCGHVSEDNRKTQAKFRCVTCGFEENADIVGAINILRAGHARLASEVSDAVRSPVAGTYRRDQSTCALTQ